ncbi:ROK family protein [Lactiplantibacillus mudanjiangensis]|uniref:ROK family protein [Lactobacillus sp.] n=1 Tax=Lactiplantibacillus mudanjiangensis TaxID=1296538 RepID=A0A660E3K5_9LACO|nr:ROK family protein [Lactiplantibacillus mudanjiangensis]VDG20131.1 ROK family protein [Lactobacillus sp.] [Lactiplantibacillus mudanjiangensis]VDG23826.1 ROK family protein [Lactobacillus sp.] [Lactiplantibacillus mudanjiangensis]VDG30354.1 ROK family protein [Lactobacillus sp.] [Lactiplantibacillus mudanjiangensis]
MQKLGIIDVGGTTIKFATWDGQAIQDHHAITTPKTKADFFELLTAEVNTMKQQRAIEGVAISAPGAVNKLTGVIEGASALPYIHNFPIQAELAAAFGLPVSIENDANCAALAELASGAGRDVDSLVFLVIGTGVGGSVIVNHQVWHGAHLFGGEFGFMLMDGEHILSELGTAPQAVNRYLAVRPEVDNIDGKQLFDLAAQGDTDAQASIQTMYDALGLAIYNLQYSFDPEKVVIGGAISNNPALIPGIEQAIEKIRARVEIASVKPTIVPCDYHDEANLRGAVVDFEQTYAAV